MRYVSLLIAVLFLLNIAGCSIPVSSTRSSLCSFTKEEKRSKSMFMAKSAVTVKDFRENEAYEEDMEGLKEDVEEYILLHPELSEQVKNDLRQIKVTRGMGEEEVLLLLGKPDKMMRSAAKGKYGASQVWIYKINKIRAFTIFIFPVFFPHEAYYLYFRDGALAEIERHSLKQTVQQGKDSIPGERRN